MILLSCFYGLSSQEFIAKNYTAADGLPSSECYQTIQDSQGNIWIATDRGPTKFDGYSFKTFGGSDGLKDLTVFRIIEFNGMIHFRTNSEKIFSYTGDTIIELPVFKKLSELLNKSNNTIMDLVVNDANQLIISTTFQNNQKPGYYKIEDWEDFDFVQFPYSNEHAVLKILSNQKIIRTRTPNKPPLEDSLIFRIITENETVQFKSKYVRTGTADKEVLLQLKSGEFLFALQNFYHIAGDDKMQIIPDLPISINSGSEFKLNDSTFLFGMENSGFIMLVKNKDGWSKFESNEIKGASNFFLDFEGGLWISTLKNGVYYCKNPNIKKLRIALHSMDVPSLINFKNEVYGVSNIGEVFSIKNTTIPKLNSVTRTNVQINELFASKDGILASANLGLSNKKNKVKLKGSDVKLLNALGGKFQSYTRNNELLITGPYGVYTFDSESDNFQKFTASHYRLTNNHDIHQSHDGKIFLATNSGLKTIKLNNGVVHETESTLEGIRINHIEPLKDNIVFLATATQGLIVFDLKKKKTLTTFNQKSGLINNYVSKIIPGKDQSYWVLGLSYLAVLEYDSTNNHLKLNRTISAANGLISGKVNDLCFNKNLAFVAGENEVQFFDSALDAKNLTPPLINISSALLLNDAETNLEPNSSLTSVQNDVRFAFNGINFRSEGETKYEYRLTGNSNRSLTTNEREVSFLNLSPGDYNFEVFAINNCGVKSTNPARFSFTILPPFYQTSWFYFLIILAFGLIIYLVYRLRIKRLEEKNNNLIANNELRQKALIAQMNPHFIFNSMNSILSLIMENKNDVAEDYLTRFSGLLRNALNQSDETFTLLKNELLITQEYVQLEAMRFNFSIDYETHLQDGIHENKILVPSLILQTLAENSILHGIIPAQKNGLITVSISIKSDFLIRIDIVDNGIGIIASKDFKKGQTNTHKSKGTNILKERVETLGKIYNTNCNIEFSDTGSGTKVSLCIPYLVQEKKNINS